MEIESMNNLQKMISSISPSLRLRHRLTQDSVSNYSLEDYQDVYSLIESLVNDFDEVVGPLPSDIRRLRFEAEQILRRYSIKHPRSEDDFRADLGWFHYNGGEADVETLLAMQQEVKGQFPESVGRLQRCIDAIKERLHVEKGPLRTFWERNRTLVCCCCGLIFVTGLFLGQYLTVQRLQIAIGTGAGLATTAFLFLEAKHERRQAVTRVCLLACSLLMLVETILLLEKIF